MLRPSIAIKSHDEVVALVVERSLFPRGFGEVESAPVRDAADYAAVLEDEGAGCAGDFFDLGDGAPGADL